MQIPCRGQSVDSITITNRLFDTLVTQNVREQYFFRESKNLQAEVNNKIAALKADSTLLFSESELHRIDNLGCDVTKKELTQQVKANKRTKFVAGILIVLEAVGIGYEASKK